MLYSDQYNEKLDFYVCEFDTRGKVIVPTAWLLPVCKQLVERWHFTVKIVGYNDNGFVLAPERDKLA